MEDLDFECGRVVDTTAFAAPLRCSLVGSAPVQPGDRRSWVVEVVEPCPNIYRCPMFPKFQSEHMLHIYKVIYCEPRDGAHRRCARYRAMMSGSIPSPMLLPHGEDLPE